MNRRTDGRTDENDLIQRCDGASKKETAIFFRLIPLQICLTFGESTARDMTNNISHRNKLITWVFGPHNGAHNGAHKRGPQRGPQTGTTTGPTTGPKKGPTSSQNPYKPPPTTSSLPTPVSRSICPHKRAHEYPKFPKRGPPAPKIRHKPHLASLLPAPESRSICPWRS